MRDATFGLVSSRRAADAGEDSDPLAATRELLDFTLLSLLSEGPLHLQSLVRLVPQVTAPQLRPTGDVIQRRVSHLFEHGHLFLESRSESPGNDVLHISPAGHDHFSALMKRRRPQGLNLLEDKLLTLKTCVLDLVGRRQRRHIIENLLEDRKRQLIEVQESTDARTPPHQFVRRCLAHEVAEIEREIRWLESLLRADLDQAVRPPSFSCAS